MQIQVALVPSTWGEKRRFPVVVVIDVLRASTTIVTALSCGARRVLPVAEAEQAFAVQADYPPGEALLCGEWEGRRIEGFDLGNSPCEYTARRVGNRTLIFASTNGSKMLVRAAGQVSGPEGGGRVIVAGFVNMRAVVRKLEALGRDCLIACSGREGGFSLEDAVCAGMIIDRLGDDIPETEDEAGTAHILYRHYAGRIGEMMEASYHGRYLKSIGMGRDLAVCAAQDRYGIVPILRDGYLQTDTAHGKIQTD